MSTLSYSNTIRKLAFVAVVLAPFTGAITPAYADKFTAGKVIKEMEPKETYAFIAGAIEGLAYSRYLADGKNTKGMACIYNWFYQDKAALKQILQTFERFQQHTPGAVLGALIKKKCGT